MGGKGKERGGKGREGMGREGMEWDPKEKSWLRACNASCIVNSESCVRRRHL